MKAVVLDCFGYAIHFHPRLIAISPVHCWICDWLIFDTVRSKDSFISLRLIAYYQLIITDYMSLQTARPIHPLEPESAADRRTQHPLPQLGATVTFSLCARNRFILNVTN
jgi:hypothetical protein